MTAAKDRDPSLLSHVEKKLIARSRPRAMTSLSDSDLVKLAESLGARVERARQIQRYLRGELRRQTGRPPLRTVGTRAPGVRAKLTLLLSASKRVSREIERRLGASKGRAGGKPAGDRAGSKPAGIRSRTGTAQRPGRP
jgi:hypothetical protein